MEYRDTKLIIFLQTFSKKELNEFEKFIISPFFKQGRDLLPLFKAIVKFHPDFIKEEFNEEIVFKEIYPDMVFGDRKSRDILKTLSSSLLKAAEEYMVISNFSGNKTLKNRIMLEELLERDLVKYYEKYRETAESEVSIDGGLSGNIILEKYFLEVHDTQYLNIILDHKNYLKKAFRSGEYLSDYFLINLLRIAKLKSFSEIGSNIKSEENISDLLLAGLNMERILEVYKDSPHFVFIGFHYYSYLSISNKCDEGYYARAKEIFNMHKSKLSRMEKVYFYSDLFNIQQIGFQYINISARRREIFNLFVSCIKDKAYKMNNDAFMQPDFFRNFIVNAIYLKEFEVADNFTEKYTEDLKPVFRRDMKYYSKALISFGKAQYEEALVNISKVKYALVNFKVDIKVLSLMVYYELKMTEQAYSMADTFKHNLKSYIEMPEFMKLSYVNFIKYYLKILNLTEKKEKDEALFLKSELEKENVISQKTWLIEKFEEI